MRSFRLEPFSAEDIADYLRRRGVEGDVEQISLFLLSATGKGHPDKVARLTDGYLLQLEAGGE